VYLTLIGIVQNQYVLLKDSQFTLQLHNFPIIAPFEGSDLKRIGLIFLVSIFSINLVNDKTVSFQSFIQLFLILIIDRINLFEKLFILWRWLARIFFYINFELALVLNLLQVQTLLLLWLNLLFFK
jgi:hypothetical protein